VVYWREDRAQFVIFKTGAQTYRNQFFYSVLEQYGTGATNTPTSASAS